MCEREFVGCPHCSEPADSGSVVQRELATELIRYPLDDEGEVNRDSEPDYQGNVDVADDGYECVACGWCGSSLDEDCIPAECGCDECEEPEPDDAGPDPDRIVVLRRTCDQRFDVEKVFGEPVPEFMQLWESRARHFQPLPRWRAAELYREYLIDPVGAERTGLPIVIDFGFTMPDEDAYKLILPGFDPHDPNYKGAPDAGHVAACA
jgi:hypothetical protein